MSKEKEIITNLAAQAGIVINGANPWDIQVHNEDFYSRILRQPHLGLGESYLDGWWDCSRLDEFFTKIFQADLENELKTFSLMLYYFKAAVFNYQKNKARAAVSAQKHYDIGNHLYELMLGKSMAYTCAYWKDAKSLDEAQNAKFDLVCKKIGLKPGMKVLDLGCGFGSFLKYAAEKYKISGVGINVSKEQVKFAKKQSKGLPLDFHLSDYREATGTFDRIVSIGLAEHIGHKNYKTLFQLAHDRLQDGGLFLLHTIGTDKSETIADPWTNEYIFPNSNFPSIKQLGGAMEGLFVMEDWHNFGADYDKTLMAWHHNFVTNWPELKEEYNDRFYRMWTYYLLSSAGAFRARNLHLWQVVLSKEGVPGGYTSVR